MSYNNSDIVRNENNLIIFDGPRPNPSFFFKINSYEFKKNILYINLEEYIVRGIYSQVVTYPCIKFKINFNPDDIIVYIKKKDELKKEYKETTDY